MAMGSTIACIAEDRGGIAGTAIPQYPLPGGVKALFLGHMGWPSGLLGGTGEILNPKS